MQRSSRIRRRVTHFLVFSVVLGVMVSYVAAGAASAASSAQTDSGEDEAVATLQIIEPSVTVRRADRENFRPGREGQKLRVGDTVKTDATGFAQVNYTDDSFTRLDVNTTFTIISLTDDEGNRQIKGSVESGQTWNRTSALTESESFEQEGAGATAAVTGTAFVVSCTTPQNCTFTSVVDGITLTTVDGEIQNLDPLMECDSTEVETDVDADLCGAPSQVTLDAILANGWILENLFIDGVNGFEGIVVVEDGEVISVTPITETEDPPADPPAPTFDPPVVDANRVNIVAAGNPAVGTGTPLETTGPNTKVSSQDEVTLVRFKLQVTSAAHTFHIVFTVLPDPSFGRLLTDAGAAVTTANTYLVTQVYAFDPVQMEPICNGTNLVMSDCFTNGTAEEQLSPNDPNQSPGLTPYPTLDDKPVDYGDGTVRWYGSFTFKAVNDDDGDASTEVTVPLEVVEDMCTHEGSRTANAVVAPC